jgi:hypothetical protein
MIDPQEVYFNDWLKVGIEKGWCGPAVCYTHDGLPLSAKEEEELWEQDPCVHIIRLYQDIDDKKEVEDNHSPSLWRM